MSKVIISFQNLLKILTERETKQKKGWQSTTSVILRLQKAKSGDEQSDIFETLSESEKQLSKSLIRLAIKGKEGTCNCKNVERPFNFCTSQSWS